MKHAKCPHGHKLARGVHWMDCPTCKAARLRFRKQATRDRNAQKRAAVEVCPRCGGPLTPTGYCTAHGQP